MAEGEELPENLEDLYKKLKDPRVKVKETNNEDPPKKSDDIKVKVKEVKHKKSAKRLEDLEVNIDKLKDKIKMVALEVDKRSADLEIKIGKVDERFKDVAYDFPELRDRAEEIDSLLQVINLGLIDFKKRFTEIDSRISNLEKVPEEVERRIVGLDNKLKKQDEDIKKLFLRLDEIGKIKEDVTRDLEGKIASTSETIGAEISDNKAEIAHLKNNLDSLSFAIKSFERTVELTNLDDMIRRFNDIDRNILTLQTRLDKLKDSATDTTMIEGDVAILKKKVKELTPNIMDALDKFNQLEVKMDKKMTKIEALEKGVMRLNTIKSMVDNTIEQVQKMSEIKNSVQDLYGKMSRIYDSKDIDLKRLHKVVKELSELDKLKSDLKEVRRAVIENRSKIKHLKG
jgi:chromosome segregation ATPase